MTTQKVNSAVQRTMLVLFPGRYDGRNWQRLDRLLHDRKGQPGTEHNRHGHQQFYRRHLRVFRREEGGEFKAMKHIPEDAVTMNFTHQVEGKRAQAGRKEESEVCSPN